MRGTLLGYLTGEITMRVLAIGLGGAGCRIATALYANDRRSSKVTCVQAIAVDVDSDTLAQLRALPEQAKIGFMAVESDLSRTGNETPQHAKIDIGEIIARIQNMERGETDAFLICCGLGGSMTDMVPHLIAALRASVTEPIFGLVTLPTLSEGEKRSAKAADDIENIDPLLDGIILFDNETWSKKIAARRDALLAEESEGHGLFGFGKNKPKLSALDITYKLLNQSIIRRISIILRAGEFRADGGIDLAEVVMDSSEILNTIRGMGFISIGYAVKHLPQGPQAFLSRLRPANATMEQRESAERIIELAKQAIYQEVSIPCDMTSAAKALILIAGPSHEISMKGVMTVRKWIDRSIAGMEMRSGDYPVTNSKYVAIIIVLSGLENIPRITELKEIREQYRSGVSGGVSASLNLPSGAGSRKAGAVSEIAASWDGPELRDEMISLPGERPKKRSPDNYPAEKTVVYSDASLKPVQAPPSGAPAGSQHQAVRRLPRVLEERDPATGTRISSPEQPRSPPEPAAAQRIPQTRPAAPVFTETPEQRHTIPAGRDEGVAHRPPVRETPAVSPQKRESQPPVKRSLESGYEGILPLKHTLVKSRDPAHQRIERELQRQQVTIKSESPKTRETVRKPEQMQIPAQPETKTVIRRVSSKAPVRGPLPPAEPMAPSPAQGERTIIRIRKKVTRTEDEGVYEEPDDRSGPTHQEELGLAAETEEFIPAPLPEKTKFGLKDRLQPARDDIFLGKSVSQKEPLRVKDAALLHTDIKTKKGRPGQEGDEPAAEPGSSPAPAKKKTGKSSAQDDKISWVND
jgi:cell division GTPase FtsZ